MKTKLLVLCWAVLAIACFAGCAGQQAGQTPTEQPARASAKEAQRKPGGAASGETTLRAESVLKSRGGSSFTVAPGWHVTRHRQHITLVEPARGVTIHLIELKADNAEQAIESAWRRTVPGFKRSIKRKAAPPPRNGWDAIHQFDYDVPTKESRYVFALARRKGATWYLALADGDKAAFGRRAAQAFNVLKSFKAPGTAKESFAGKKARPLDAALIKSFDAFVEAARLKAEIPGVAVGIVHGGKLVFEKGYGLRQLGKQAKVTPRTLFMIASMTKPLTTLMMARLVDLKRFSWQTPVKKLMPSFSLASEEVTRKLTMANTVCACAGLPRQDLEFMFEWAGVTADQRIAGMKTMKPTTGFGETFQYSNTMVSLGGYAAALAYRPGLKMGRAYDAAMAALVFKPLGMTSTTMEFKLAQRRRHARPHGRRLDLEVSTMSITNEMGVYSVRPAGAVWSNIRDMSQYLLLELGQGKLPTGKRLVSVANMNKRREPQVKMTDERSYGLGLFVETFYQLPVVGHAGNMMGFSSDMFWLPEHDVGLVLLTNASGANYYRKAIKRKLLELLFDGRAEAQKALDFSVKHQREIAQKELKKVDQRPEASWIAQLVGEYTHPNLGQATLTRKGGRGLFDVGEWKSSFGRKNETDGTKKIILLDPPWAGLELIPRRQGGKRQLVLEAGQLKYVFEAVSKVK
jgi:CubicO group peptidase (beta-lactamase class C family)